MRENDDDARELGGDGGSLADGLGETVEPGDHSSASEPYGDGDIDDADTDSPSVEDADTDSPSVDDGDDDGVVIDTDGTGGDPDTTSEDGGYGEGETGDDPVVIDDETDEIDEIDDVEEADDAEVDQSADPFDESDVLAHDASPLEGVGFLLDEVRDALFGDDDESAASAFDTDPVDLETDTDLDLTGDGVVDTADLQEARSVFDFHVDHHGGHEGM